MQFCNTEIFICIFVDEMVLEMIEISIVSVIRSDFYNLAKRFARDSH